MGYVRVMRFGAQPDWRSAEGRFAGCEERRVDGDDAGGAQRRPPEAFAQVARTDEDGAGSGEQERCCDCGLVGRGPAAEPEQVAVIPKSASAERVSFSDVQEAVGSWHVSFMGGNAPEVWDVLGRKAVEEAGEFHLAFSAGERLEEAADLAILAMATAYRCGADLSEFVLAKLEVIKGRDQAARDAERGFGVKHVESVGRSGARPSFGESRLEANDTDISLTYPGAPAPEDLSHGSGRGVSSEISLLAPLVPESTRGEL